MNMLPAAAAGAAAGAAPKFMPPRPPRPPRPPLELLLRRPASQDLAGARRELGAVARPGAALGALLLPKSGRAPVLSTVTIPTLGPLLKTLNCEPGAAEADANAGGATLALPLVTPLLPKPKDTGEVKDGTDWSGAPPDDAKPARSPRPPPPPPPPPPKPVDEGNELEGEGAAPAQPPGLEAMAPKPPEAPPEAMAPKPPVAPPPAEAPNEGFCPEEGGGEPNGEEAGAPPPREDCPNVARLASTELDKEKGLLFMMTPREGCGAPLRRCFGCGGSCGPAGKGCVCV